MSYSYQVTERRKRTTRGTSPSLGGIRTGSSSSNSTFGYWVPLVITVTAASIGIAAWIWSERKEDDEDSSVEGHNPGGIPPPGYASMSGGVGMGMGPGPQPGQFPPGPGSGGAGGPGSFPPGPGMGMPPQQGGFHGGPPMGPPGQGGYRGVEVDEHGQARSSSVNMQEQDQGLVARMSSALGMGRSSSPANQTFDWASKRVAAGVAAAGAMAGTAMKSMGMSGEDDAERWSEEADQRDGEREPKMGIKRQGTADEFFSGAVEIPRSASMKMRKRKAVAVVVSAMNSEDSDMDLGHHASILAHLPEHVDPYTTRVFVLICAPELKTHPLSAVATQKRPSQSMASSFSNISQKDVDTPAQTPGEFPEDGILASVDPNPLDDSSSLYKTLHNQAQAVVEKDTMILPFTTPNGHKHILKSLQPEIVYIQESLCGEQGEVVSDLSGWVRQTVVVIGDEGGAGGLVDTDDEDGREKLSGKWWMQEERTGLGKRVAVVEGVKVGDDWKRRLNDGD